MSICSRIIVKSTDADVPEFRQAIEKLRDEGRDVEVRVTWEAGDAERYAAEMARAQGEDGERRVLVAAGGDGLANGVLCGLLRDGGPTPPGVDLGLLPLGTANDFASAAGVPVDDLEGSLRLAVEGKSQSVDAGFFADRPFLNMVTAGAGASATRDAPDAMKKVLGRASYFFMGLLNLASPQEMSVKIEGDALDWEGKAYALLIANGRQAGGGLELCGEAMVDDGLLDLCLMDAERMEKLGGVMQALVKGQREGFHNIMKHVQGKNFRVTFREKAVVNVDGEPVDTEGTVLVRAAPAALRMILPGDCKLLQANDAG